MTLMEWFVSFLSLILISAVIWFSSSYVNQKKLKKKIRDEAKATAQRMDDAQITGDDPAAALRWLRERNERRGDL